MNIVYFFGVFDDVSCVELEKWFLDVIFVFDEDGVVFGFNLLSDGYNVIILLWVKGFEK